MTELPTVVNDFINAGNAHDADGMLATFPDDALVIDDQRTFWGKESIGRFVDKEIVGAKVTMDVVNVRRHYDTWIVDAELDGTYDKTGLPDPLVLSYHFTVTGDKITTLMILSTKPGY
ncbi:nuclear transport factor 2 family protein [Kibdelosporangium persicum]|uniref:Nuclear transport factor 2 family protein n=1 Tax=Kibdelosporangium persicum TaxID=2698649 RepID=A0ABX2F3I5_9PSEU|nr:nuclear transport factor 2 family protein [Kibdelosporangium persicum]NRN65889.1 Nuclear transport factor 2 family protein [Kibdelosporangium persicum]